MEITAFLVVESERLMSSFQPRDPGEGQKVTEKLKILKRFSCTGFRQGERKGRRGDLEGLGGLSEELLDDALDVAAGVVSPSDIAIAINDSGGRDAANCVIA